MDFLFLFPDSLQSACGHFVAGPGARVTGDGQFRGVAAPGTGTAGGGVAATTGAASGGCIAARRRRLGGVRVVGPE